MNITANARLTITLSVLAALFVTFVVSYNVGLADADTRRQAALFVVYPSNDPHEDQFDCGQGWAMHDYLPTANGGAHITCVKLHHGETRKGYSDRRNAGKVESFRF